MTDTIEVAQVLNSDGINAWRAQWTLEANDVRARHNALLDEIEKLKAQIPQFQLQEAALNGAIQACDVLLKNLTTVPLNQPSETK